MICLFLANTSVKNINPQPVKETYTADLNRPARSMAGSPKRRVWSRARRLFVFTTGVPHDEHDF